jgi:hypothetical protein
MLTFAVASIMAPPIAAQTSQGAPATKRTLRARPWSPPLTPDGHPDLEGNWVNRSATPLERPEELQGRQFLTDAEVAELKRRAERIFKDSRNDFPALARDDFFLASLANLESYKNPNATGAADEMTELEFDNRTSLIVDPPDGRLPPYTPAGQRRQNALLAATRMQNPPAGTEDLTNLQRCITWGVPMPRPGPYTSYYQIVQSPGYVVIALEAIHDARIIPLDGRPHLRHSMPTWNGDSRGRWVGKTMVVDTTNFSSKDNFLGSAENLHLVERFTRVAPDEIRYEMTADDPTTWTKPWTAVLGLKQTQEKVYEVACHEGNFWVMKDMLSGDRVQDNAAK